MLTLPRPPVDANERSLASWIVERVTGIASATVPLTNLFDPNAVLLFKNGTLVDPASYTLDAQSVTVSPASIVGDVWVMYGHFRSTI